MTLDKDFSILINADVTDLDIENFYKKYKEDMGDYNPECVQYTTTQQEILESENGEITIIKINNVNSSPSKDTINHYLELCNISLF